MADDPVVKHMAVVIDLLASLVQDSMGRLAAIEKMLHSTDSGFSALAVQVKALTDRIEHGNLVNKVEMAKRMAAAEARIAQTAEKTKEP